MIGFGVVKRRGFAYLLRFSLAVFGLRLSSVLIEPFSQLMNGLLSGLKK
jgi:hypothetical protein